MLDYIIQVLLFQTLFLAVYDLFLKRETFFQWNRVYLLVTSVVAYCIPFIKMNSIQQVVPQEYIIQLPEIMLSPTAAIKDTFDWSALLFNVMPWIFWIGMILMISLFIIKLTNLVRLIYKNEKLSENKYQLVFLDSNKAFSFFKYIFLGKALSEENKQQIIAHELVHVGQKHTLDLLFFEVQKMICWFNPFSYLFQHRISELHEFIADAKTVQDTNKKDYFQNLLSQTFGTHKISFINSFLKISLIKKRIVMLNKIKSKKVLRLKYLLLIPVLLSMLVYTSCETNDYEELLQQSKLNPKRFITLHMGGIGNISKREMTTKKEGYFDVYMLGAKPSGKEIFYEDLLTEEKEAYDSYVKKIKDSNIGEFYSHKIFIDSEGKKAFLQEIDWKAMRKRRKNKASMEIENISVEIVEEVPVFPGCDEVANSKDCLTKSIHQFVTENFDMSYVNSLGLKPGKKKIYVQFEITKEGYVQIIGARAPHEKLKETAVNLIDKLPNMTPGKHKGKYVNVTYMLPISFNVQ